MAHRHVLIATFNDDAEAGERLRSALCEAWTNQATLRCVPATPPPSQRDLRRTGAMVVPVLGGSPMHDTLTLLEAADIAGVPVLVLVDDDRAIGSASLAGALTIPNTTPVPLICATLDGLIHAGADARRLRADLSIAHRTSGGLEGEIVKMHEELQLAAMVQRELLPRELPHVHGVEFGALWRPAHYVSGDIYDVCRLDEDHVGIFLADSVGHGVPAALMTMVINRSLVMKEFAGERYRILSPGETLTRLNAQLLHRQGRTTRFATAVCAIADCRRRVIRIATAGHPAPLLIRGDHELTEIKAPSGGLLGIFEDERYEHVEIELEADDRLLFYSDGFEQAFPRKSSDAYTRMLPTTHYRREFQEIAMYHSPAELIEQLRNRLDQQQGSLHQADDLTLICLHAGPLRAQEHETPVAALARTA